ncbi:TIGR02679 domain-containing protein [Bacillus litorisediminis]|uniref:TIGR02679 domain-containing protein n=1 Tax=Bacillus litorisediminis TaxID=2922713 RepID=UPI001FADBDD2|nr:TIGR02679 domain-containing protein [Bacillus litorisediminis]
MSPKEEAVKYFKERAGYSRIFLEFAKKIESLGDVGGHVELTKLTQEERVLLRNWFQKDYSTQRTAKISLKKFEEKFKGTKFDGALLYEVVEGVIGRKLVYKKAEKNEMERNKIHFFEEMAKTYSSEATEFLTASIYEKHPLHVGFTAAYNKGELKEIEKVFHALSLLPLKKHMRLPLFAEKVTGNPHEFDNDGRLISALQMVREKKYEVPVQTSPNAEYINQLLFDFGILKDDITNYVSVFGLMGERGGRILHSWVESFKEKSVRNEPLREVIKLDRVYPVHKNNPVFVVENSGVFSSIVDELEDLPISIICTHGQFKLAAIQIIKLLTEESCQIYYSGDFDPEGILMAYSLKQKYPEHINYWRYSVKDYNKTLSNIEFSAARLQKLENIDDNDLKTLINQMQKVKKASYQEGQIKGLIKDVKEFNKC